MKGMLATNAAHASLAVDHALREVDCRFRTLPPACGESRVGVHRLST